MKDFFLKEYSYDGHEIYRIENNNQLLYLGSKYNMQKEIDLIQNNIKKISKSKDIIVFGAGNGVWLEQLDGITTDKRIVIVEPNRKLFDIFVNKKHNINQNQVSAICMEDDDFYNNMLSAIKSSNFSILIFSNYDFVYKDEFEFFVEKIKLVLIDKQVAENTNNAYSKIWFENYIKNIPYILQADCVNNYVDIFNNKPAIIVSAGPSLDKNIKLLKGNEDKFIVIAVGRVLKALKRENIKVDFTAIIDGSEKMFDVFEESLNDNIPLLFSEQTGSKIIEKYNGKKIFFSTREFINADKEILGCEPISLFQGGSVAHACIDFARVLGCDPIVFIGQDLAYTGDKAYSNNSVTYFENNQLKKETEFYTKGVKQDRVKTNYDFNIFRERIEMMINLYSEKTFINSTEGGAHIEGATEIDLKEVIDKYTDYVNKSILNNDFTIDLCCKQIISNLKNIHDSIDDIIEACIEAKKINKDLVGLYLKSAGKYNKALSRLDEIDSIIKQNTGITYLFETLTKVIEQNLINLFCEEPESESIIGKIKNIAKKGEYLYGELINALTYGEPLIKECIESLEEL